MDSENLHSNPRMAHLHHKDIHICYFYLMLKTGRVQMQKILYGEWVRELVTQDSSSDILRFLLRRFGFKTFRWKLPVIRTSSMLVSNASPIEFFYGLILIYCEGSSGIDKMYLTVVCCAG